MFALGGPAFLAFIKFSGPLRTFAMMNGGMLFWGNYTEILNSVIERIAIFMMNDKSFGDWSEMFFRNVTMLKNPSFNGGTNFAKSVSIVPFALTDANGSNRYFGHPGFIKLPSVLSTAFRRTGLASKWSIPFKILSANWAATEVLSHAAE